MNDQIRPINPQLALVKPPSGQQKDGEKTAPASAESTFEPFGGDGFTFLDFIDIINPLQHIPLVSTLYRNLTDDTLDPGSKIAGGTLFGGPIGAAASLLDVAIDENTGKDIGEHAMALLANETAAAGETVLAGADLPSGFETAAGSDESVSLAAYAAPNSAEIALLKAEAQLKAAGIRTSPESLWSKPGPGVGETVFESVESAVFDAPSGAEIALLKAEATLAPPAVQVSELPPPPAPPAKTVMPAQGNPPPPRTAAATPAVATNIEVLQWARQETEARSRAHLLTAYGDNSAPPVRQPAAGAVAEDGGWFSEVMLSALDNYQKGANLNRPPAAHAVNFKR